MADMSSLIASIRDRARQLRDEAADNLIQDLLREVPVDTGKLRGETRGQNYDLGDVFGVHVVADTDYAAATDTGSVAHPIEPRGPWPLKFQIGGVTIRAWHVDHPGTKGTRWFSDNTSADHWRALLEAAQ